MSNGDLITTSHMYPVICWRKDSKENFFEYKILTEEKPYIKNAVNIIHLPNNEFTFTSNSWPSIKFFKFDINNIKDNYTLIKDMRLNCSAKTNTLALYKKEFIIVPLNFDQLCLIDVKNKEIVSKINGINLQYLFIRNNGDILMRGYYQNNNQRLNIYRFKEGELVFSGILQNKLQISVEEIMENEDGKLYISGYEYNFNGNEKENKINKIYLLNK